MSEPRRVSVAGLQAFIALAFGAIGISEPEAAGIAVTLPIHPPAPPAKTTAATMILWPAGVPVAALWVRTDGTAVFPQRWRFKGSSSLH